MRAGLDAGGEEGPVHSSGLLIVRDVSWPVANLRVDWSDADPIADLERLWALYEPQLEAYVTRAIDPIGGSELRCSGRRAGIEGRGSGMKPDARQTFAARPEIHGNQAHRVGRNLCLRGVGNETDGKMDHFDLGAHSRTVSTSSTEAQRWFDLGLNWCFGFNKEEGVKCFLRALDHDPECAMAHWGVAYGTGTFLQSYLA